MKLAAFLILVLVYSVTSSAAQECFGDRCNRWDL